MVGELMHGREVANWPGLMCAHDRLTWYLNFESGWYRKVVSSSLLFSWTIIDTDDAII